MEADEKRRGVNNPKIMAATGMIYTANRKQNLMTRMTDINRMNPEGFDLGWLTMPAMWRASRLSQAGAKASPMPA